MAENTNTKARERAAKRRLAAVTGPETETPLSTAPAEETGGIVAEAEKELEAVKTAEPEAPGETEPETAGETEPETAGETEPEVPGETEPEAPGETEPEPEPEPEVPAMAAEGGEQNAPVGQYQPPEGATYDELMDQYHEALSFGDNEQAKIIREQIREHEYAQITHRMKSEAQAEAEELAFLAVAKELAAKHPELGEDGIAADKVLALKDIYWKNGMREADALRSAVADLYPEETGMAEASATPPASEAAAAPSPSASISVELPDMGKRMEQKRKAPSIPIGSARVQAVPETPPPTADSRHREAAAKMRAARGSV